MPDSIDLTTANPIVKEFRAAVSRAPESVRSRISDLTSSKSGGKWTLRDRDGVELWEIPDAPLPVGAEKKSGPYSLDNRVAQARQLGLSNAKAVVQLAQVVSDLLPRVKRLDEHFHESVAICLSGVTDVQHGLDSRLSKLEGRTVERPRDPDQERRGIVFRGAWQQAVDYEAGSMVTHNQRAYITSKAMRAGKEPPNRQGSGWVHMFDSTEVPHPPLESVAEEVAGVIREVTAPLKERIAFLEAEIKGMKGNALKRFMTDPTTPLAKEGPWNTSRLTGTPSLPSMHSRTVAHSTRQSSEVTGPVKKRRRRTRRS